MRSCVERYTTQGMCAELENNARQGIQPPEQVQCVQRGKHVKERAARVGRKEQALRVQL